MTINKQRVLCIDDEPLICEGLRSRLDEEADMAWAGAVDNCSNVVAEAHRTGASVAVMEIMVNGADCIETIRDLAKGQERTRVLVLSRNISDRAIHEAFEAGALGYFSKHDGVDAVIGGIREVGRGDRAFGPSVRERCVVLNDPSPRHNGQAKIARFDLLTAREREVLRMIGRGMSRRQIADAMHRSPKTIDCHRASLMEKLGINDRVELARYAIREGLAEA